MKIYTGVLRSLVENFPCVPPESGGILGCGSDCTVCVFCPDPGLLPQDGAYLPDVEMLNRTISAWQKENIRFCGMMHSHYPGDETLSRGDERYIQDVMAAMPECVESLYFPIVIPKRMVIPFRARRTGEDIIIEADTLEIVERKEA